MPFAVWANQSTIPGVGVKEALDRTKFWNQDPALGKTEFNAFRNEVCQRFKRSTVDEPLDNRSIESVAWMANELRARVAQRFATNDTRVSVFRGEITAEARNAAGITKKLKFIDGYGKSRLDRRHHAVDAAVVAFTTPFVAEVLVQRRNKRDAARLTNGTEQWKEFTGATADRRAAWNAWLPRIQRLAFLVQQALDEDRIVVTSNLRLRLGNGRAHEDTIGKLNRIKVGAEMSTKLIDRAASEALWCALTRDPEFDPKEGLPANPDRRIRIHGTWYGADDEIEFFPGTAGCIKVRGGYAELSRFHHARIYKITSGKKPVYSMLRVYNADLARHRNEDLFTVEMKPQSMSVRQSEDKLRKALADGTGEYLGWVVVDDELQIDSSSFTTGQVGAFQKEFGNVSRWRIDGFYSNSRLRLRPLQLSAEGLSEEASTDSRKVIDRPGWLPSVNVLFAAENAAVIRRDSLGRARLSSSANLPTTWKVS